MKFSKSELDIIYQYAAPTKAETLAGMKEIVPVIKDLLTKAIVENAIRTREKMPEPECSRFVFWYCGECFLISGIVTFA